MTAMVKAAVYKS